MTPPVFASRRGKRASPTPPENDGKWTGQERGNTEEKNTHVLSFGAGVNTVALMVLIRREKLPLDLAVFADTGGETPGTYRTVRESQEYLRRMGVELREVENRPRNTDLYHTSERRRVIPSAQWRWCTRDFKVRPIQRLYRQMGGHILQYMGIARDEVHRMRESRNPNVTNLYPLVERGITRQGCIDLIRKEGLPVPEKSGCYFCPFNSGERWREILERHPGLFDSAVRLEENSKHFPRQRLTDQMFRDHRAVTLREFREHLADGGAPPPETTGEQACGGECMT